eukprot:Em0021g161a
MAVERQQPRIRASAFERLEGVNCVIITESVEAATGFETVCKYSVMDAKGESLFTASEATNCCLRQICGAERPFGMSFTNEEETEVMYIERPYRGCCFTCGFQQLDVESPPGTSLGHVTQDFTLIRSCFTVADSTKQPVLSIRGPFLNCRCCDINFEIFDLQDEEIGWIKKDYSNSANESAENVTAKFPMDLDVQKKALIISACFLVGAMFFGR